MADGTLAFDREWKGSLYARAGIAELWIVNLVDRVLEVHRDPSPSLPARYGSQYRDVRRLAPSERVAPLGAPGSSIEVASLLP